MAPNGIKEGIAKLDAMKARAGDLSPLMRVLGEEFRVQIDDALHRSRSPAGEDFPELADSTKIGRILKRKGARIKATSGRKARAKRSREALAAGNFTQWAHERNGLRDQVLAFANAANLKPLVDTARGRNSVKVKAKKNGLTISIVRYIAYHMTGSNRKPKRPKRNVLPIEYLGDDKFRLIESAAARISAAISSYVQTGATR